MFEVNPFDIDIGQYKVMLHQSDARQLGINFGDRVRVRTKGAAVTAILDVTSQMVEQGHIGIFNEAMKELKGAKTVDIMPAPKPASVAYIKKLMDNQKLTEDQIRAIVRDIVDNNLSEVELSAYLTASYIYNMDAQQTEWLTRAMIETGDRIYFDTHPVVDKHSIGGVPGNKVTMLVVPIVAAAGLLIPKTSSRAITGAGGTADLMEILAPVEFTADEIKELTETVGGVIAWGGATNIAPADDKLIKAEYALSIDPYSQMLASIMAKKGAVGAEAVVVDMPTGPGTKLATAEEARKLAKDLMDLGERLGIRVECAMTFGGSPVGRTVGPAVEIKEALAMLETGTGPNSLREKSLALAGILLEMGGMAVRGDGGRMAEEILTSGRAHKKLMEIIEAQGGDPNVKSSDIQIGEFRQDILSPATGYVVAFYNKRIIEIARLAGAPADKKAGVIIHKKMGEMVKKGEPLLTICSSSDWELECATKECALMDSGRQMPIVVEGMLLERYPRYTQI
ncbi:MAG: AMP phosphorylase [Methanosaeta sp. PtaB.Bin039]|nr:MAG: AMP phosphorylase [Methanosaeta sp. PtaB.Bin039]OPY45670.1 MAG: AMP phosphorylase [Methanosaeta sp. PtaU1.Bin028]HOT06570.1 AMP phosphorylase [Methanotrichaceae archaeon]HQF16548.1 AMP phosphorylase [Methanotrichaceae archaeon]HQI91081.1 AMP phosphorylase [Methanotrichaceae archaeon]